ncbi:AraC family transcriptional regulator [Gracilibacillus salinarum]|uniref:AraC family transcriptional regulator n=1 Tax=Gracilibacillus salinarum TaxID=2932255 RepID=A0ABY4GKK7_9BACI|nr:helix-turn-helix domain-containing protein [Gracilibacillus salinarum]UOQ84895.1 AraC family transcriptional regulator [Gracilibacillus salinarum]
MSKLLPIRFKQMLRKNLSDTQTRLLLILMIPVLFIILTVGFSSYYTSKEILQQEINEPQSQILQMNMHYIDEYIEESDKIAVKLALDNNIFRFITNPTTFSYPNIKEIYDKLTTITQNASYVQSIYIYNTNKDSFVAIPQGYSSSSATFNDAGWTDVVKELQDQPMVVKYRDLPDGARYKGSNITLFRKISIKGEVQGVVAINLNESELFAKLKSSTDPNSNSMQYILDPNNTILYKTSNRNFDAETIDFINHEVREGNLTNIRYNDKVLLANQTESEFTGWKYVSVVSQESILAKSKTIRDVVFVVSLIALIIGAIAIFFIHSIELKPIRRLKKLFEVESDQPYQRDLLHLEHIIDDLVSDHAQLESLIRKMKQEAKSKFIYDIYIGKVMAASELREKWQTYFSDWKKDNLQVLMVSIDHYPDWKENVTSNYRSVVKAGMVNILTEVLGSHYEVEAVDIGKEKLIILLQHKEGKIHLENHLKIALTNIENILGYSVSVGMHDGKVPVQEIKTALNLAELALQYRLFDGYSTINRVSETETAEDKADIAEMDRLVKAISMEEPVQSIENVTRFFDILAKRTISPDLSFYFIEQIRKEIFTRNKEMASSDFVTLEDIRTMHVEDIAKVFKGRISEKIENIQKLHHSKRYIKCRKMIQYMSMHLSEPIGIPEIAESVGISVSLASQWFKEEMNDTIYGYFTRLKMERAQELLTRSNMKIADIALEVGYQHENSFIRKFREYKEMTPGKYRRLNAMVDDNEQ